MESTDFRCVHSDSFIKLTAECLENVAQSHILQRIHEKDHGSLTGSSQGSPLASLKGLI